MFAADITIIGSSNKGISMSESTEVAVVNEADSAVQALGTGAAFYSSIKGTDFTSRVAVAKAMTTSKPIDENLDKVINLRNIIVQPVTLTNPNTGEQDNVLRTVLLDDKMNAFHATSKGIDTAVRNILGVIGDPSTWDGPVPIKVVKVRAAVGSYFSVEFV
jgi:hypothetical protein